MVALIESVEKPAQALDDAEVLLEMAEEEDDAAAEAEAAKELTQVRALLDRLEFRRMMSGETDANNAIITINAGAGGTESQDWAGMLLRMLSRYCERQGFKTEVLDLQAGEEAGIKSATLAVEGDYAYGYLQAEAGVHRLVRISPFDSAKRRHTSFASVYVTPEVDDDIEIVIEDST